MTNCSICFEPSNQSDINIPCGHSFHNRCITEWLLKKTSCPLCRDCLYDINDDENDEDPEPIVEYSLFTVSTEKISKNIETLINEFARNVIDKFIMNRENCLEWVNDPKTDTQYITLAYNKKYKGQKQSRTDRYVFTIELIQIVNRIAYFVLNTYLEEVFYNTINKSRKHIFRKQKRNTGKLCR